MASRDREMYTIMGGSHRRLFFPRGVKSLKHAEPRVPSLCGGHMTPHRDGLWHRACARAHTHAHTRKSNWGSRSKTRGLNLCQSPACGPGRCGSAPSVDLYPRRWGFDFRSGYVWEVTDRCLSHRWVSLPFSKIREGSGQQDWLYAARQGAAQRRPGGACGSRCRSYTCTWIDSDPKVNV